MLGRGIGSCILCFLFPEPIPVTPSGCFGWKKEGWIFFCGLTIPTLALVRSVPLFSSGEENALKCSALFEHSFPFLPDRHKEPLRGPRARLVCLLDMAHREAEAELAPSPLSSQELGIVLLSPPPPPHLLLPLTSSFLSSCSSFFSPPPLFFLSRSPADPDHLGCVAILLVCTAWTSAPRGGQAFPALRVTDVHTCVLNPRGP